MTPICHVKMFETRTVRGDTLKQRSVPVEKYFCSQYNLILGQDEVRLELINVNITKIKIYTNVKIHDS